MSDGGDPGRIDLDGLFPEGRLAMGQLEAAVRDGGLDPRLLELVRVRCSQLNGCAFCLDMHTKDARALGETEQRLYGLAAWREAPFYSPRERSALAVAEAVTHPDRGPLPDALLAEARSRFTEAELACLVYAVVAINAWNRLAIAGRFPVGDYQSGRTAPA